MVAINYMIFAVVATIMNILAQDISLRLYDGRYAVGTSILVGTGAGLIVKYMLDKRYIFHHQTNSLTGDAHLFILYSVMGVVTTLLFWMVELGFDAAFGTKEMRYLGAVIGLSIGYFCKYHLDRRFVFVAGAAR
jgi:putative flippase GtrA